MNPSGITDIATSTSFLNKRIIVARQNKGSYFEGRFIPGDVNYLRFWASVQPLRPNETLILPEARRTQVAFRIYTDVEILTVNEAAGTQADLVQIDGNDFEVMSVERWALPGSEIAHWKAIAVKVLGEGGRIS